MHYALQYGWYVYRARDFVLQTAKLAGGDGVVIVGHSAGGWLGRAVIGDTQWITSGPANKVCSLLE